MLNNIIVNMNLKKQLKRLSLRPCCISNNRKRQTKHNVLSRNERVYMFEIYIHTQLRQTDVRHSIGLIFNIIIEYETKPAFNRLKWIGTMEKVLNIEVHWINKNFIFVIECNYCSKDHTSSTGFFNFNWKSMCIWRKYYF